MLLKRGTKNSVHEEDTVGEEERGKYSHGRGRGEKNWKLRGISTKGKRTLRRVANPERQKSLHRGDREGG